MQPMLPENITENITEKKEQYTKKYNVLAEQWQKEDNATLRKHLYNKLYRAKKELDDIRAYETIVDLRAKNKRLKTDNNILKTENSGLKTSLQELSSLFSFQYNSIVNVQTCVRSKIFEVNNVITTKRPWALECCDLTGADDTKEQEKKGETKGKQQEKEKTDNVIRRVFIDLNADSGDEETDDECIVSEPTDKT